MILSINNELCSSIEQLKGYFSEDLTSDSDIYNDLIDVARQGEMSKWLLKHNEKELASQIDTIPSILGNHDYFKKLKVILIGSDDKYISDPKKPTFEKCFHLERISNETNNCEINICVSFKVKNNINEYFKVQIVCGWGTRGYSINSSDMVAGESLPLNFKLRELPGSDIGEIQLKIDGEITKIIEL